MLFTVPCARRILEERRRAIERIDRCMYGAALAGHRKACGVDVMMVGLAMMMNYVVMPLRDYIKVCMKCPY